MLSNRPGSWKDKYICRQDKGEESDQNNSNIFLQNLNFFFFFEVLRENVTTM